jgi:hypothetical protein
MQTAARHWEGDRRNRHQLIGDAVSARQRRSVLAVLAPLALAALLTLASPAAALECDEMANPNCGGGGPVVTTQTVSSTLTVTKNMGSVASTPAGIDCGSDCTHTDSQTVSCIDGDCAEPDPAGWEVLTLTASGFTGYAAAWTNCPAPSGNTCTVTMDADRTVAVTWTDVTNPTVSLTSPGAGSVFGDGELITLHANASDNAGVAKVEFLAGGAVIGADTTAPYTLSVNSSTLDEGNRTFAARATDIYARQSTTAGVTVNVDKTAPAIGFSSGPADGASTTSTAAAFAFTVAEANLDHVTCRIDDIIGEDCPSLSASYTGLALGEHTFTVTAYDTAGHQSTATRTWTVTKPATTDDDGGSGDNGAGGKPTPPPVTTPPPGLLPNTAKVSVRPQRTKQWTRLRRVTITGLPSGATVTVACKGGARKACPKGRTLAAIKKAKLKPGAVVTITIAKAGTETKTVTITIRKGKAPAIA